MGGGVRPPEKSTRKLTMDYMMAKETIVPEVRGQNYFERYLAVYGPYAFGVVSLLLIWYTIVRPELANNRISTVEIRSISDTQRQTAQILDRTTGRLEAVAAQLERIKKD